jgi:2-methylcitrate dehydratase
MFYAPFEGALALRETWRSGCRNRKNKTVDAYDIAVDTTADSPDKWDPINRETADHSMPYINAVALINGRIWLDDFSEERVRNPLLRP